MCKMDLEVISAQTRTKDILKPKLVTLFYSAECLSAASIKSFETIWGKHDTGATDTDSSKAFHLIKYRKYTL